jgi:hypothetical protein
VAKFRRRPFGRGEVRRQPEGKLRQSQVVTTFGPGAMVDLVDHAVLIGGLNYWRFPQHKKGKGIRVIHEPRLRDALAERLRAAGVELHFQAAFREPPSGDDDDPSEVSGIQALEFPQWFVCQNESCRALTKAIEGLEKKDGRYYHSCSREKKTECVPVRFVLACRRGHCSEFPWLWFAHRNRPDRCPSPLLRLTEGPTGDFSEIRVVCACGARESLSQSLAPESQPTCNGDRPWLGREGKQVCEEKSRLLVRTASNSYFAQVVSALSIPDPAQELEDAVRGVWDVLKNATTATLQVFRSIDKVQAAIGRFADMDVMAAVDSLKAGKEAPREPIRTAEFVQFLGAKAEQPGDLPQQDEVFFARTARPSPAAPKQVRQLILAHKLREVRAQIGFTRLEASTADLQGEYDMKVESAALGLLTDWLPASEVRGEGVFIAFREDAVQAWEKLPVVVRRAEQLMKGYDAWAATVQEAPPFPGARFYMLHSLAHLLVTAVSLECGYAASAIRERIYCAAGDSPTPMAAILLSTGTSGQEGTLGGLVEQGRRITDHLRRAWDLGVLCSNDPVCAGHGPDSDPTERQLEGAACHGCLFVAECSCERFNRYLDRALVVPSIGHPPEMAFFAERP